MVCLSARHAQPACFGEEAGQRVNRGRPRPVRQTPGRGLDRSPAKEEIDRGPILDHRAEHAYTTARDWVRRQLLPWAVADTDATWYATVGRTLFEEHEEAFGWWTETPEYLRRWDQ